MIAVAGIPKKEYLDKRISPEMDGVIESRTLFTQGGVGQSVPLIDDNRSGTYAVCAMPVFTEGDVIGCVAAVSNPQSTAQKESGAVTPEAQIKLIQTAAAFLGRQMEP